MSDVNLEIRKLLTEFFKGDTTKVNTWLHLDNLNFGGSSPMKLMSKGRSHKVLAFIKGAIDDNKREEPLKEGK